MPLVIINAGSEVLYLLRQRLLSIHEEPNKEHICLVLAVIAGKLFDKTLIDAAETDETYSPGSLETIMKRCIDSSLDPATRQMFPKNEDFCATAFSSIKCQLYNLVDGLELVAWTYNHLDTIKRYLDQANANLNYVYEYVDKVSQCISILMFNNLYHLNMYTYVLIWYLEFVNFIAP